MCERLDELVATKTLAPVITNTGTSQSSLNRGGNSSPVPEAFLLKLSQEAAELSACKVVWRV